MNGLRSYESLVKAINEGSYNTVSSIKSNPQVAAILSKTVKDPINPRPEFSDDSAYASFIQGVGLEDTSFKIADSRRNNDSMMQLFPETELSSQILISSILSPKDMIETTINFSCDLDTIPTDIKTNLLKLVSEYIEKEYKLKEELPDILKEILFISGSYTQAIIPESKLDQIINNPLNLTTEHYNKISKENIGILGSATSSRNLFISTESANGVTINPVIEGLNTDLITVSDNYETLKLPLAAKSYAKSRLNAIIGNQRLSLENEFYAKNKSGFKPLFNIANTTSVRRSIGKPLVMKLTPESVIPVHTPGDHKDHIGYFILLDESGNPVSKLQDSFNSIMIDGSNDFSSNLIERSKNAVIGNANMSENSKISDIFSDIVEQDLINRLKNGIYGNNVSIGKANEVYRLMLSRTLKGLYTKILYLPKEFVSYMANDYHDNGVGKTLVDNMRTLNSIRAMSLFSRTMAGVKNSIGATEVKLKLDERDPDPQKTIEMAVHEIIKTRQQSFPVGINTPNDIVDWVQRSGLEFVFEGHPKIPSMGFEFNQKGQSNIKPDTELDEDLSKRAAMALGLNPEIIDNAYSSEFAASVHANNLLFSKRVSRIQQKLTPHLTYLIRLLIVNDSVILKELQEAVKDNKENVKIDENLISEFINAIEISLPSANISQVKIFTEGLEEYKTYLDSALEAVFDTSFINQSVTGDFSGSVDDIKAVIKAYYVRKWITDNNALPELAELLTDPNQSTYLNKPFEEQKNYIQDVLTQSIRFLSQMQELKIAASADIGTLNEDNGSSFDDSSSESDTEQSDEFGDDGLGMETDITEEAPEEEPAEEKPAEESTESDEEPTEPEAEKEETKDTNKE